MATATTPGANEEIFNCIRSSFANVSMADKNDKPTVRYDDACFFNFNWADRPGTGTITVSTIEPGKMQVFFNSGFAENLVDSQKKRWNNLLRRLRAIALRNIMDFDARSLDKPGLTTNDRRTISANSFDKEKNQMAKDSLLNGKYDSTLAKVEVVAENSKVKELNIVQKDGTKFAFSPNLMIGAKALVTHLNYGGTSNDKVAEGIKNISKKFLELTKLSKVYTESFSGKSELDAELKSNLEDAKTILNLLADPIEYPNNAPAAAQQAQAQVPPAATVAPMMAAEGFSAEKVKALYELKDADPALDFVVGWLKQGKGLKLKANPVKDKAMKSTKYSDTVALLTDIMNDIAERAMLTGDDERVANWSAQIGTKLEHSGADMASKLSRREQRAVLDMAKLYLADLEKGLNRTTTEKTFGPKKTRADESAPVKFGYGTLSSSNKNPNIGKMTDQYSGDPEQYHFNSIQRRNYDALKAILARNGDKFNHITARTVIGDTDYTRRQDRSPTAPVANLTSFKATSKAMLWNKYEGAVAGGGSNTVRLGKVKMQTTKFLKLDASSQDKLVKDALASSNLGEGLWDTAPPGVAKSAFINDDWIKKVGLVIGKELGFLTLTKANIVRKPEFRYLTYEWTTPQGTATIKIKHDWKSDGTPTKPVTTVSGTIPGKKVVAQKLGRFAIWEDSKWYGEDIANQFK